MIEVLIIENRKRYITTLEKPISKDPDLEGEIKKKTTIYMSRGMKRK